jgi:hypothetical protein
MLEETQERSFEFSLGDDADLKHLLRDINSSFSIEASCSFDFSREITDDLTIDEKDLEKNNKRKRLSDDVK